VTELAGKTFQRENIRPIVIGLIIFAVLFNLFNLMRISIFADLLQASVFDPPLNGEVDTTGEYVRSMSSQAAAITIALGLLPYLITSYFMVRQKKGLPLGIAMVVTVLALLSTTAPGSFRLTAEYLNIGVNTAFAANAAFAVGVTFLGWQIGLLVSRRTESP
jgi:hypothetical protein